jgi:uncharacterized lipoprotein YehR (DUF1307 family)
MKKSISAIVMLLAIFSLTACGNNSEKAVKEAYKEMGLSDEEVNEIVSELDSQDIEEMNNYLSGEEASESDAKESSSEEVVFTMSDTIKNASLSDGIIQIYDMIFPVDGSITMGECVKILESSSLDLEYEIPEEGMVQNNESFSVNIDRHGLFTLHAKQISDDSYDNTYDSMLYEISFDSYLEEEYVWFPNGISKETDIDTLEDIFIASNLSDDYDTSKYHYHLDASGMSAQVPAKNNTLNGSRFNISYYFRIDSSNKKISSFSVSSSDTKMKDYANALGYLNNATAITSTAEITDDIIAALDEFDDVYIGHELEYVWSVINPTSAEIYAIGIKEDHSAFILSKCDTENGVKYVKSPLAPIYVNDKGEIFISYEDEAPIISFRDNDSDMYGDVLVVG